MIHENDTTCKWVYVEAKDGALLAKEFMPVGKALAHLRRQGWVVATKRQSETCIVFRVY